MILRRAIHRIRYLFLALLIIMISSILFLLTSTKVLQWTVDTYAPRYHLEYEDLSGTFLTGFEVKGLSYKRDRLLDNLKADWNPVSILYKRLSFNSFEANGLYVENINTAINALQTLKTQNNNTIGLPFSVAVEELKLNVNPFTHSGVKFKNVSLDGKDIVFRDEFVDIEDLFFSMDTNVTKIELSGGVKDKHIRVEKLSILDVDTIAFTSVIKEIFCRFLTINIPISN